MVSISNSSLQRAATRLRDGTALPEDERVILEYRNDCAPALAEACSLAHDAIFQSGVNAEFAARLKRYESIVRKAIRQRTHPGRMDDIVGVRMLVRDRTDQKLVVNSLNSMNLLGPPTKDYVAQPQVSGYRAVHHFVDIQINGLKVRVEVQLRTYLQHLWASLSESFGQQVKEGDGPVQIREYLSVVSESLALLDSDGGAAPMLPAVPPGTAAEYFVLAFASGDRSVWNQFQFGSDSSGAVGAFTAMESRADANMETVLLFCREIATIRRTHISYFPASLLADLMDVARLQLPDWVVSSLLKPKDLEAA